MRVGIAFVLIAAMVTAIWAQDRPARSVLDGVYTKTQAGRGEPLYKQHCAGCHGQSLEGVEMAPALAGGDFVDQWAGQSLGDLFERIRATMPQDKPGRLSRDVNADVVAYVLSYNQYPAGETELSRDTQVLKQIKFEAPKPK